MQDCATYDMWSAEISHLCLFSEIIVELTMDSDTGYRDQFITFGEPETKPEKEGPPGWEILWELSDNKTHRGILIFISLAFFTTYVAVMLKQNNFLKKITEFFPESGCLMVIGIFVNLIMQIIAWIGDIEDTALLTMDARVLEHVMITPIILHAAYDLYHPHFFGQFWTIVIYAFVATMLNAILIALIMVVGNSIAEIPMHIFICLTYASIISAVDPVAVLAVFEAVNADQQLYYLVFGESVLNDGVTFVMFDAFKTFTRIEKDRLHLIPIKSYLCVVGSFITKPLGGIFFGYLCGLGTALVTKYTTEKSSSMIPLINLLFAALAYVFSLSFKWSGILSLIAYALTQERYTFRNISDDAKMNTKNLIHGVAIIMETLLFFFLGSEFFIIQFGQVWKETIIILVAIYFARIMVTIFLTRVINHFKIHGKIIDWRWQVLIIVGGLRGAVAFAMVVHYTGPYNPLFYDVTVITIFFTSIVNGILAKPLVSAFDLKQVESSSEVDYKEVYGDKLGMFSRLYQNLERKYLFKALLKGYPEHEQ